MMYCKIYIMLISHLLHKIVQCDSGFTLELLLLVFTVVRIVFIQFAPFIQLVLSAWVDWVEPSGSKVNISKCKYAKYNKITRIQNKVIHITPFYYISFPRTPRRITKQNIPNSNVICFFTVRKKERRKKN